MKKGQAARSKKYTTSLIKQGLCVQCRTPTESGKQRCESCILKKKISRGEKIKLGLCSSCGAPAVKDRTLCSECALKLAFYRCGYRLTSTEKDAMLKNQHGKCAICEQTPSGKSKQTATLHVDHDHTTGKVRGLLCGACNRAIGALHSVALLQSAAKYLKAS